MPDDGSLCRNFIHLRDTQHTLADQVQTMIDQLVAELEDVLVGEYLQRFRDAMNKPTMAERLRAVEDANAHLIRNLRRLLNAFAAVGGAGAPLDPWPSRALNLYGRLIMLLRALIILRAVEDAFDTMVQAWCD